MKKTNPVLKRTIAELEEKGRKEDVDVWKDLSERLKRARRKQRSVNLSKIDRYTEEGETVVVPGKVTGSGKITKKVTVAAVGFSDQARSRIEEVGTAVDIRDLVDKNPSGKGIKIMEG